VEFRVLGPLEVVGDDGEPVPLGGQRPRALLAALLLDANRPVSVERLIDAVWGESPPASAPNALQVHVHSLRSALGAERILTRPPGYVVVVRPEELDAERFEHLVTDGRRADALALWRGPALADLAAEPFAQAEAARLDERRLTTLEARLEADLDGGRHAEAAAELEALVLVHPHRERLRGQQMLALYRAGRQADALAAYRDARSALDELGLEPSPELRALEKRILEQDPTLAAPSAAAGADGDLVGRERELAAVVGLLGRADVRLITLTGTGGSGKTRLAQAAARAVGDSVFVDLAPVGDPALVLPSIARSLGIVEAPTTPLLDQLAGRLGDSPPLLVLDNLEHLEPSFATIGALLEAVPEVRILATSRIPLHLAGEREYRVPPLPVPAPEETTLATIAANPSVRLYVERAVDAVPAFALGDANAEHVARICRALDGLPLAIELAAARIRVLGPEGTARRLGERLALLTRSSHDLPERQRSVRGAIDWSYELLDGDQQRAFRALGVFAGAVGLDAVEEVVGAPAHDLLDGLLDASLVTHAGDPSGEPRFGMLETLRAYAVAELEQRGELDEARRAHAAWYLDVVERAEASRNGGDLAPETLQRLDADHSEILAALAYLTDRDLDATVRLVIALREYWRVRGLFDEATLQLERVVERLPDPAPATARHAVGGAAFFAYFRGNWDDARSYGEQAVEVFRDADDRVWVARTQQMLAGTATSQGDFARARELCREAAAYFRETDNWYGLTLVLGSIAEASRRLGELDAAREAITEALSLRHRHGDETLYAFNVVVLAGLAAQGGDHAEAIALISESLPLGLELKDFNTIPPNLFVAARVAVDTGDADRAALLLGAAETAMRRLGDQRYELERAEYFDPVDAAAAEVIGAEQVAELRAAGRMLEVTEAAALATGIVVRDPV
jgi:predicted ATPase/DNA-binding SARP family transcriptional activator